MKMKKFVSLALCVVMMMSLLVTTAFAKGEENLSLSATGTAEVGETIVVKVNSKALVADSFAFSFDFDNVALECVSIEGTQDADGVYLVPEAGYPWLATAVSTVSEANASGTVGFGWAGSADVNYKAGTIAVVTFKVVAEPAGDLEFVMYGGNGLALGNSSNATVQKPAPIVPVAVTGVDLNKATLNLKVGKSATLVATVNPSNADNKAVVWSSSDESVATVDQNGKVTAKKVGTATITVTTVDGGYTDTCSVTVTKTASSYEPDVESPKTFDAGAAMYIGVTLLAAAGSAVVLKKKD